MIDEFSTGAQFEPKFFSPEYQTQWYQYHDKQERRQGIFLENTLVNSRLTKVFPLAVSTVF